MRAAFLKATGEAKSGSYVGSAAVKKLLPDFEEDFNAAAARVELGLDKIKELRLIRLNLSALTLIDNLLQRYHDLKRKRGLLDFEDLITRTVALLARNGAGQWVQYKLDRGIDHILVDEAQDTSPDQWQVIRMLSEEFSQALASAMCSAHCSRWAMKSSRSTRFRVRCRKILRHRAGRLVSAPKMQSLNSNV